MLSAARDVCVSLAAWTVLGIWSLALAPLGWIVWAGFTLCPSPALRHLARRLNWYYGRASLIILRPFLRVRRINPGAAVGLGPCIVIANHQSMLDLYMLGAQDERQVCPVTRSWPFRLLFIFTASMRAAGYVEAEGREPTEVLADCRARLAEKAALVVYPEGHRSRTGRLGHFHAGAFLLALEENIPIVPMVIKNSFDILRPGSWILRQGVLEVELLPPVMPVAYGRFRTEVLPHRALLRHVRSLFEASLVEFESRRDITDRRAA